MYQLSAPAFTANFTGNYRPVYGPGTKTRAISRREVNRTFEGQQPLCRRGNGPIEPKKVTFDPQFASRIFGIDFFAILLSGSLH